MSGNNIFTGTDGGVFLSVNNGASWSAVDSGLPANSAISSLAVMVVLKSMPGVATISGISDGGYVWYRPLSEMVAGVNNPKKNLQQEY